MAKQLNYRDTGFKYVRGGEKVLFSNGICLTVAEFEELEKSNSVIRELLQRQKDGVQRYDYSYAVEHGRLLALPKPFEIEPPPIEAPVAPIEVQEAVPFWKTVPFIVELVMLAVAGGSAVMSAYHTTVFMYQSGKPFWVSILTGCIMIFFSATAFTAGRYFFQEKGAGILYGAIFAVLGSFIVFYSMFSTVTVNFSQFKWADSDDGAAVAAQQATIAVERERVELLDREILRIDGEIERLQVEAEGWRNQSWARYDRLTEQINGLLELRQSLSLQRMEAGTARAEVETVAEIEAKSVYEFIARLFNIKADAIRFVIYVIPAVFYDIASPFGFTIILLLEDKRRKKRA